MSAWISDVDLVERAWRAIARECGPRSEPNDVSKLKISVRVGKLFVASPRSHANDLGRLVTSW